MNGCMIPCPVCGTLLDAPPEAANCAVRCGRCKSRFTLPAKMAVTSDAIASWLYQDRDNDEVVAASSPASAEPPSPPPDPREESMMFLVDTERSEMPPLRLVRVGADGALLEFPAGRLGDESFRRAMPRMCVRCEGRSELDAHVIIYTPQLKDSMSLEAEHHAGKLCLSSEEARGLTDSQVLEHIGRVPNVPHPADLPMLYWLCEDCAGVGTISGQINVNRDTGQGWCRLRILNLPVAEKLVVNTGAEGTAEHAELQMRIRARWANPWQELSQSVRNRLEGWFEPQANEKFIAYIPDRDRTHNEDGMYGLVVSNQRFICHCQYRHHESPVDFPLHLQWSRKGAKPHLRIRTPRWEMKKFSADREGVEQFKRALRRGGFHTRWY